MSTKFHTKHPSPEIVLHCSIDSAAWQCLHNHPCLAKSGLEEREIRPENVNDALEPQWPATPAELAKSRSVHFWNVQPPAAAISR